MTPKRMIIKEMTRLLVLNEPVEINVLDSKNLNGVTYFKNSSLSLNAAIILRKYRTINKEVAILPEYL